MVLSCPEPIRGTHGTGPPWAWGVKPVGRYDGVRHAGRVNALTDDVDLTGLVLPPGVRRAGVADLDAVYAIECAHDRRYAGRERQSRDEVRLDLERPRHYHWLREGPDGTPDVWVGAASLPHVEHNFGWVETVAELDDETGTELVRFAHAVASRLDPAKDVHIGAGAKEESLSRWIAAAGGVEARRFGRMEIPLDLAAPPAAPAPPEGVTLRTAADTEADWKMLYDVVEIAFRDHYGHVAQSYEDFVIDVRDDITDFSLVWIASVEGRPAAALLGTEKPAEGYIGTLGTLREFRKRGLGRVLLETAFAEFARRGHRLATLHVDLSNPTGAVRVYESAGMCLADYEIAYAFPHRSGGW
jgi:mycothiol synthase